MDDQEVKGSSDDLSTKPQDTLLLHLLRRPRHQHQHPRLRYCAGDHVHTRRLHRFEKEYSQLLHIWRDSSSLAHDDEAAEQIEIRLQELTDLLLQPQR
ncbi:uncharacterized protein B0T15DRAFT_545787 [Chaetomium strumarium]|uniref:Uncharacterized protein n=1 Tax=Chaetomium strumarium TaxID=1170767 RepID=A0AAJ0H0W9_9PEZI|nr:hypothetical protein B0T15DRAFT_545787 [Chaetomium strumarium]